jgi:uncharacterized ferredoxin-like protein
MCVAARTAPKSAGRDYIETVILEGEAIARLAADMCAYGEESGKRNFDRDAANVAQCPVVVLIGLADVKPLGLNCGACGAARCIACNTYEGEFRGPACALHLLDLGIALGSAVKTAAMLCADNRIMYRIGVSARRLGLCRSDVVMGIPLSATGKSIFFDR